MLPLLILDDGGRHVAEYGGVQRQNISDESKPWLCSSFDQA